MGESFRTLAEMLQERARKAPGSTAFTFLNDGEMDAVSITYGELDARARAIAKKLLEVDAAGKPVLVLHPPGLEFIAALFGCFYSGAIAVPSYPPSGLRSRSASRLANIVADARPLLALSTIAGARRNMVLVVREPGVEGLRQLATDTLASQADCRIAEADPDVPALIQYTSGSTGSPRGVTLTHANLLGNLAVIRAKVVDPIPPAERVLVSWVPPYHDMGLMGGILSPVFCQVPAILMDPQRFLQRPLRWLEAIARYRGSIGIAPNSALDLCARAIRAEDRGRLDLGSWQVLVNGAEPVRAETLDRFENEFRGCGFRRRTFLPSYGLAESTLLVTAGDAREEPRILTSPDGGRHVSCGTPGAGHSLIVADPETGQPLAEGERGEICVAGASVSRGYWGKPEESAELFRNGFLRTGDLGFLSAGELYITGRLKDLIIVNGRNLYPQDLERAAELAHPALAPDASAAFSLDRDAAEQVVVVCEVRREQRRNSDSAAVIEAVRRAIAEEFDVRLHAVVLAGPGAIPRTTSGKIRRRACREAFESGALDPIAAGNGASPCPVFQQAGTLVERIRATIAGLRKIPASWLDDERPISSLGVDSLMRTELLLLLEAELDSDLDASVVDPAMTIPEMARRIEEQGAAPGNSAVSPVALGVPGLAVPLTPRQRWFLRPGRDDIVGFSTIVFLRTPRHTDSSLLERALHLTERQHDALRLRLRRENDGWRQEYVQPGTAVVFDRVDISSATPDEIHRQRQRVETELPRQLDPERGPLVRAVWFDRGGGSPGLLFVAIHHLVCDGLSVAIFVATLERLYRGLRSGNDRFAQPRPSFGEWAAALDALAQSPEVAATLPYWREVCRTSESCPPAEKPAWKWSQARSLDPKLQARLDARFSTAREQYGALLAAFWHAWEEASGGAELFVELENHGRGTLAGCAPIRTIGWFVSRFPARFHSPRHLPEEEKLSHIRECLCKVPWDGAAFGMLAYLHRNPTVHAEMMSLPRPRLAFTYYHHLHDIHVPGAVFPVIREYSFMGSLESPPDPVRLTLNVNQRSGVVTWHIVYDENVYSEPLARALSDGVGRYLEGACSGGG